MARLVKEFHPLLADDVLKKLFAKNIFTVLNFVESDVKQLTTTTGLTYKDVLTIKKRLLHKNSAVARNALDYYNELLSKTAIISTGVKSIDDLLEGGLKTGNVYEICGKPGSGKTQLCLTATKFVVQSLGQQVYYIDTKCDFSARKMMNLLSSGELSNSELSTSDLTSSEFSNDELSKGKLLKGDLSSGEHSTNYLSNNEQCNTKDLGETMEKILVNRINTLHELVNLLHSIKDNFKNYNFRLIIIDSLPALIYQISDKSTAYGILNNIANVIRLISTEYHVVFLITNAITHWVEISGFNNKKVDLSELVGCGKYWVNIPQTRIKINKRLVDYEVSVMKSTHLKENRRCFVKIDGSGMKDI